MTADYYTQAERLAELLVHDGEQLVAHQITEVIAGGTTATEILMGLRFYLQQALDAGRTGREATTAGVRELLNALDKALT